MQVTLSWSPAAREVCSQRLELAEGATLGAALKISGLIEREPQWADCPVGIWGRIQALDTVLQESDRIELYRPLRCDPKEARRERYRGKGAAKTAKSAKTANTPGQPALSGNPKP